MRQFERQKVCYENCITSAYVMMDKTYCQEYDGQVALSETKVEPANTIYIIQIRSALSTCKASQINNIKESSE